MSLCVGVFFFFCDRFLRNEIWEFLEEVVNVVGGCEVVLIFIAEFVL